MWIHGSNKEALDAAEKYIDSWSSISEEKIPKYIKMNKLHAKTSIIVPVYDTNNNLNIMGVINFESEEIIEFSKQLATEIDKIVKSISVLYTLNHTLTLQTDNTLNQIRYLGMHPHKKSSLHGINFSTKIFLACSDRADQEVMRSVDTILNSFEAKKYLIYSDWRKLCKSGIVISQIIDEISQCKFGLCYLSEKKNEEYVDNPNVLFEAGLIAMMCENNKLDNLILIREESETQPPFDLMSNRILKVPRGSNGKLDKDNFQDQLRKQIEALKINISN